MNKRMMGLAFCIAAFTMSAAAQTNTFPASGNVGIGTTAPNTKIEIDATPTNSIVNTVGLFNTPTGTTAQGSGVALIMGYWNTEYYDKIATIFESQNPNYLQPALGFFTMYNTYVAGSETEKLRLHASGGLSLGNSYVGTDPGAGNMVTSGSVGIGTTAPAYKLDVAGIIRTSSGGIVFPDGSTQTTAFNPTICGGDYAESVDVAGARTSYEPGDVLVIDPKTPGKFLKANQAYSTLVAGIYSTKPGTVGRRQTTAKSPDEVPMAVVGIVPTKVSAENGPIQAGDLLVASSTLGRAMKGTDRGKMLGAVVGKALGNLDSGTGVIEVLVTLQ
jgi:hypothetical protein